MAAVWLYEALDVFSAGLSLVLAARFGAVFRRTGRQLHLLVATGFLLLGLGFLATTRSTLDLLAGTRWDALFLAAETSGALVLALAYLGAPAGPPGRAWRVLAWTAAAMGVALGGLYWVVPPASALPEPVALLRGANTIQFVALLMCTWLAVRRAASPWDLRAALVPAGFLGLALSKYTWALSGADEVHDVLGFVLAWRLAGLGSLLAAAFLPESHATGPTGEPA